MMMRRSANILLFLSRIVRGRKSLGVGRVRASIVLMVCKTSHRVEEKTDSMVDPKNDDCADDGTCYAWCGNDKDILGMVQGIFDLF
jgi:hypothetical protein